MIVVATEDFEVYHGVVNELRDRGVTFTTIEPDDDLPEGTTAVVTAAGEEPPVPDGVTLVNAAPEKPRRAVEDVLTHLRGGDGQTVIGVDPASGRGSPFSPGISSSPRSTCPSATPPT